MKWGYVLFVILLLAVPVNGLYKEGEDKKGIYIVEDYDNYPIIFIPGVAGTELWWNDHDVWPGWVGQRITGGHFDKLALTPDGKSKYSMLPRRSLRYGVEADLGGYGRYGMMGIYGGYFTYMDGTGYSLEENEETGLRYYDFGYDWRKSNYISIKYLDELIDDVLDETSSDKVILHAHSMGGVVARLYLKDKKNAEKVAAVIFMGTPHQGSPKPFLAFTEGYNFGNNKLTNEKMWEIMSNWEAGYQLLPKWSYIMDVDGNDWSLDEIYGDGWIGKLEYEYWQDDPSRTLRYGLPHREYAQKTVAFQKDLGDTLDYYPWIDYYMIEGVGQKTTYGFLASFDVKADVDKPVLQLIELTDNEGDGTVPARGAQVNGLDEHFYVEAEHGSIPSVVETHYILTGLRKKINNEEEKESNTAKLETLTANNLVRVKSWPSTGSVWKTVKSLSKSAIGIKPDEEKIKARENLRGKAKAMLDYAHINIYVEDPTIEDKDERVENWYVVVNDYSLMDAGPGIIKPGTAKVYMTKKTFNDVLNNRKNLGTAFEDGDITVKGVGVVNGFVLKMYEWIAKWKNRSTEASIN